MFQNNMKQFLYTSLRATFAWLPSTNFLDAACTKNVQVNKEDLYRHDLVTDALLGKYRPPLATTKTFNSYAISSASAEVKTLEKLMAAGINISRFNFSHGEHDYRAKTVDKLREAAVNYNKKIGTCYPLVIALDTKGPEIRTGLLEGLDELELVGGHKIRLPTDESDEKKGEKEKMYVDYANITKVVKEGNDSLGLFKNNNFNAIYLNTRSLVFNSNNFFYSNNASNFLYPISHILTKPKYSNPNIRQISYTSSSFSEKPSKINGKKNTNGKEIAAVKPKKTIKQKIVDELMHYYHGFKLLGLNVKISFKLALKKMRGIELTRREHNLLVQTVADIFRLLPFSVFIVVPFLEFTLPIFIKIFPGMLPTTFQTKDDKEAKLKQSLKLQLEMARFLQETLDNMCVPGKEHDCESAKELTDFFTKARQQGVVITADEILKFSKLFKDEITLDSFSRPQLVVLCRVLELRAIGTSNFLRFKLRLKLRSLAIDDKMIHKEGVDSLTFSELQQACKSRGMRVFGLAETRLRQQLTQWLNLSLNEKVPPSLLLLSGTFSVTDNIPTRDLLKKEAIPTLPIDNKAKFEDIKKKEREIEKEEKKKTT